MPSALIVEDNPESLEALVELVEREGFAVASAGSLAEARERLAESAPDVLLTDLMLPDGQGIELLAEVQEQQVESVMITGHASVSSAVEAMRLGAADYLIKPVDLHRLRTILRHLSRARDLRKQIGSLRGELRQLGRFGRLIGGSTAMQEVYDRIGRVGPTDANVLITGATGTGKELAARSIHDLSDRRESPFLPLNCGAVPEQLIESELFGHERGSFSGAHKRHVGYFERADGGTLFLDEITEMPIELQAKLLRVLETGRFNRIGGEKEIEVDVRVLAATNLDPQEAVEEDRLRGDLLYRLGVFRIDMPALVDREGDVDLLLEHFLAELNEQHEDRKQVGDDCRRALREYAWPGNVRELKNVLYSAFIMADEVIEADALPDSLSTSSPARSARGGMRLDVGMTVAEAERQLIEATLESVDGNKRKASEILGISLRTLYNRLKEYSAEPQG